MVLTGSTEASPRWTILSPLRTCKLVAAGEPELLEACWELGERNVAFETTEMHARRI